MLSTVSNPRPWIFSTMLISICVILLFSLIWLMRSLRLSFFFKVIFNSILWDVFPTTNNSNWLTIVTILTPSPTDTCKAMFVPQLICFRCPIQQQALHMSHAHWSASGNFQSSITPLNTKLKGGQQQLLFDTLRCQSNLSIGILGLWPLPTHVLWSLWLGLIISFQGPLNQIRWSLKTLQLT